MKPEARITRHADRVTVDVVWQGVDRPCTFGWSVPPSELALAQRLAKAVDAGAVMVDARVVRDVNGRTFVAAGARVLGRTMNADLKRLGF